MWYYHSRYFIWRFNWPRDHYITANNILVPRAHDPFGLRQGSRPLAGTEAGNPRITDFRLLCAASEIWTITVTIGYKNGQLLRLRVTWPLPEVSILDADQKDRGLWGRECANNCLRIIVCSCALRCEVVLLRIILLVRSWVTCSELKLKRGQVSH